ncbi:MAG: gamma carbonic anhydrase family protein [Myxococcales bacterium]|nr:gamma carbonic anhydrase family protein [Myxococcales bacterium]
MIYRLGQHAPSLHETCYVAPSAQVMGHVVAEARSSIWFNTVLRGDNDLLHIGEETNVQDGSVLHTDDGIQLRLGSGVTVGHKVMLHGCEVGDYSLVGMNAVILNRARVGKYCLIGANTLITEGKTIPDGSVVMGSPGKVVRALNDQERALLKGSAAVYVRNGERFRRELTRLD